MQKNLMLPVPWRALVLPVFWGCLIFLGGCQQEANGPPSPSTAVTGPETSEASVAATPSAQPQPATPPDSTATLDAYPLSTATRSGYPQPEAGWTPRRLEVQGTPTVTPTPTPTSTATPPALLVDDLDEARVATMGIWRAVDNDSSFPLYQISRTPRGVANVRWTPDGQHLTAELLTSEQTMMGYRRVPLVLSRAGEKAWSPLFLGNNDYFVDYEWSPDGSQMVLVGNGELQVVDASGDLMHSFPPPADDSTFGGPQFLPDSDSVIVTIWSTEVNRARKELWVYDLDDGTSRLLLDDPACSTWASWSPQGDAMACLGEDYESTRFPGGAATLWLQALDGTPFVSAELASLPGTEGSLQLPQWVAGGQTVVATVLFQPGVWLVDRDGNVTSLSAADASLQSVALGSDNIGKAAVNPTGEFVLFDPGPGGNTVLNVATGEKIPIAMPLLEIDFARWAPQTPHFLAWRPYHQRDAEGMPLQLVDARTGEVQTLDNSGSWPSWSPDGRRIAYWKKAEDGKMALWLLELGGEPRRLTSPTPEELGQLTYYNLTPHWAPDGRVLAFVSLRENTPQAYVLELE